MRDALVLFVDLFKDYYNCQRTHQGLDAKTPELDIEIKDRATDKPGNYRRTSYCRGPYHLPIAA